MRVVRAVRGLLFSAALVIAIAAGAPHASPPKAATGSGGREVPDALPFLGSATIGCAYLTCSSGGVAHPWPAVDFSSCHWARPFGPRPREPLRWWMRSSMGKATRTARDRDELLRRPGTLHRHRAPRRSVQRVQAPVGVTRRGRRCGCSEGRSSARLGHHRRRERICTTTSRQRSSTSIAPGTAYHSDRCTTGRAAVEGRRVRSVAPPIGPDSRGALTSRRRRGEPVGP